MIGRVPPAEMTATRSAGSAGDDGAVGRDVDRGDRGEVDVDVRGLASGWRVDDPKGTVRHSDDSIVVDVESRRQHRGLPAREQAVGQWPVGIADRVDERPERRVALVGAQRGDGEQRRRVAPVAGEGAGFGRQLQRVSDGLLFGGAALLHHDQADDREGRARHQREHGQQHRPPPISMLALLACFHERQLHLVDRDLTVASTVADGLQPAAGEQPGGLAARRRPTPVLRR